MSHQRVIQVVAMVVATVLVSCGVEHEPSTATSEIKQVVLESANGPCLDSDDVFQLGVAGTYTAFAFDSFGLLVTEVRGDKGAMLATSHPTSATMATVDLLSGIRFGLTAPQVFEVESQVTIQVRHENSPYELMLVRISNTSEVSRLNVRPLVERIVKQPGSCSVGAPDEVFKIHTDSVYSDTTAHQLFVVESPDRPSRAERLVGGSTVQGDVLSAVRRSFVRGHLPFTFGLFPIR